MRGTPRSSGIEDESATGGNRPGAGVSPEPKPKLPRAKTGPSPARRRFRRTGRIVTQRRGLRRVQTATRKDSRDIRALWLEQRVITGLPSFGGRSGSDTRSGLESGQQEERKADSSSPPHDATNGHNGVPSDNTAAGNTSNIENSGGGANELPDVSPEFRSEMAAIRAHYGAMIAAARRRMPGSDLAAAIRALLNEETIAMRAVAERWQAATQRQRDEKPQRPMGTVRRRDDPKSL